MLAKRQTTRLEKRPKRPLVDSGSLTCAQFFREGVEVFLRAGSDGCREGLDLMGALLQRRVYSGSETLLLANQPWCQSN